MQMTAQTNSLTRTYLVHWIYFIYLFFFGLRQQYNVMQIICTGMLELTSLQLIVIDELCAMRQVLAGPEAVALLYLSVISP